MEKKGIKRMDSKEVFHMWKGRIWFLINMFFSVMYLLWRIFFTIPFEYGIVSIVAGIALLVVEVLGMVEALIHYANMAEVKGYPLPEISADQFPDVDVFIATYSEECSLLYKTINGCKYMDYPDKNKVHIYLCDDNRRPEMRALAEKMGVHYLDRPDNEGAKAGNLNNALAHSSSPYVVTLDADMIPKSDFLLKTIPYFVDAERRNKGRKEEDQIKLGFVQTPQCFYNPDLFQFNLFSEGRIPNEQDYFYKDIQVARTKTNSVIYGGSNTVIAREALEAIGGFYTEAITEDFATGILMERAGYVSLGIGEPLASGMSATDLKGLVQQRVRWARGVISTGRKMHIFTTRELSFSQKMNYWASIWYWYAPLKRLIYIMSPILYATFGFMVFKCTLIQVLIFWLPMYITSNISLRMLSNNIRSTKWTGIYETVLFPYMLLPVLLESVGITLKKFKVTDKGVQQNKKGQHLIYTIPFLILIILSILGIINCIRIMFDSGSFGPVVVLFWLVNNLFLLVMSLFFVDGRIPYRKSERVRVMMDGRIDDGRSIRKGTIRDISETGVSVLLEEPYYLEADSMVSVEMENELYHARLQAQIVFVSQQGRQWNYSMKILDYGDSYDEYLQMLYDRVPVLPQEIKRDSGSFEDLKLNTQKRLTTPFFQKRQYPRILLDVKVDCYLPEGESRKLYGQILLHDFNYCYACVEHGMKQEKIVLKLPVDIELECRYEKELRSGYQLYEVTNCKELLSDTERMERLMVWLKETNEEALNQQEANRRKNAAQKKKEEKKKDFDETELIS